MTVVPLHSVGPTAVMHGGGAGGGFGANKDDTPKDPLEVTIFTFNCFGIPTTMNLEFPTDICANVTMWRLYGTVFLSKRLDVQLFGQISFVVKTENYLK